MKIEYNVLWLDDQIDAFIDDGWVDKIKEHLEKEGFNPNVITVSKQDDFFSHLDTSSFDLILTDYNLAGKNDGIQIAKKVRRKSNFTEILFYTAQTGVKLDQIDRITFLSTGDSHHEKVVDKAISLIDLTIKKFQHIVIMRGMIMHETSSLDIQCVEILKSYLNCEEQSCGKCTDKERCNPIAEAIFEKLEQHFKAKTNDVTKLKEKNDLKKLIKDDYLFSSKYKIKALSKILEKSKIPDFTAEYEKEIIKTRNEFAHAVLKKDEETGREYFQHGKSGTPFDEERCKTIRKDINKHKRNLENLRSKIPNI
jgi:CheY-like chemotaxis protein